MLGLARMVKVLIMGASGRIGFRLTKHLLENGHSVAAFDKSVSDSLLVLNRNQNDESRLLVKEVDVYDLANLDAEILLASAALGGIDAAVYTAWPASHVSRKLFQDLEQKAIIQESSHQIAAPIMFAQRVVREFLRQGHGNLIFVSSIQGIASPKFHHYEGLEMTSPVEYSMGKAAIIAAAKYLAKYLGSDGIRVNTISPGGILDGQDPIFLERYRKDTAQKGMLDPDDLLSGFDFLLSERSKFYTGQNLVIDDGWSL